MAPGGERGREEHQRCEGQCRRVGWKGGCDANREGRGVMRRVHINTSGLAEKPHRRGGLGERVSKGAVEKRRETSER